MAPLPGFHSIAVLALLAVLRSGPEDLLRRSDLGSFAPDSFRARLSLKGGSPAVTREIEIWRSSAGKTLVRFLDPNERGKYLLRLEDQLWFLSPGAKKPVRLSPSHRVYGGIALDEVFAMRLSEQYRVESATEESDPEGPLVVLELRAKSPKMLFPEVRYVVRAATERPVRAIYRLRSGREATGVEFVDWKEGEFPYARRVIVSDLLRKGTTTEVEILEMERRVIPDAIFDLRGSAERSALESVPSENRQQF